MGLIFLITGVWLIASNVSCTAHLMDVFGLKFTFWPPMIPFVAVAGAIGFSNARRMRPVYRELEVLLTLAFGLAAAEGAAWHTGVQAERWFAALVVTVVLTAVVWWLDGTGRENGDSSQR